MRSSPKLKLSIVGPRGLILGPTNAMGYFSVGRQIAAIVGTSCEMEQPYAWVLELFHCLRTSTSAAGHADISWYERTGRNLTKFGWYGKLGIVDDEIVRGEDGFSLGTNWKTRFNDYQK